MEQMVARCGLVCTECPAGIATRADDEQALARIAEAWTRDFKLEFTPETIRCDGCIAEGGRRSAYCASCAIRPCAEGRRVGTCAQCGDYPCEKLAEFLLHAPEARANLERLRA